MKRTAEIASCVLRFVAEFKFEFLGLGLSNVII